MPLESYEQLHCIGQGSQGTVHLVRHLGDGSAHVIKRVRIAEAEARRAALCEAEALQMVDHTAVVGCRECFVDGDHLCMVLEYCEGGDLSSRIARAREDDEPFSEEQVLAWFVQLALALHHVHWRGLLHRDVKAQNVFISRGG